MTETLSSYYGVVAPNYGDCYRDDFGTRPGDDYPANKLRWEWVRQRLHDLKVETVLEAGCGEGTPMLLLQKEGFAVHGFDSEPEMVHEVQKKDIPGTAVWKASILDAQGLRYDAVCAMGPLPHLCDADQHTALRNLAHWTEPGGHVFVEMRNELFALFTQNRYTAALYEKLLPPETPVGIRMGIEKLLEVTAPPKPVTGTYDAIFSRFNNPLTVPKLFSDAGLRVDDIHYYHAHAWPPRLVTPQNEAEFRRLSLALEWPAQPEPDWRQMFLCSAFIVEARRA